MFKSINGGILPCRFTRHSAGFDVYSNEDVVIGAGETKHIGLGIVLDDDFVTYEIAGVSVDAGGRVTAGDSDKASEYLKSHYFALHIRSSLRAKGLTSLGTGIIDMDYRDEIKMVIHNPFTGFDDDANQTGGTGWNSYHIKKGDKIGQLILCRHEGYLLPNDYTLNENRNGGFGSTDKETK